MLYYAGVFFAIAIVAACIGPYAEIRKYSIKWCNAQRDHQQFDGISRDKLSVIAYIFSSQPSSGISLANWSRSDDARRA